jgi:glycosyltransferase involved in cell wall biosynthesis
MSFILNKLIYKTIVICKNEKDKLVKLFNCKEGKIKIIYNGVDMDYFKLKNLFFENKTKKVGILARLSSEKNHDFFLKMAIEIIKKNNNIEFYIAGDGPRMKKLEYRIEKIKAKNIHFLGNISNVKKFLQEMDITCLVSKSEVLPMSILESMSVGTPVVSVNVGGINEIINLKNGWIIDYLDLEIFSKTIINIFNNYPGLIKKSLFSRKTVEQKFFLEKMISNIEEMYLD